MTLAVFALATSPVPVLASDGVLEINDACARRTGCFSGDAAGYPVTIDGSAGHSYRLTSDLILQSVNTDGIVVNTSYVGIDLNNFAILGPVTCPGTPPVCDASGSGSGVERTSTSNRGISVKNGTVSGMGNDGVQLGDQAEVTKLRVRWNRGNGITVGAGSNASGNTAYENGLDGINASSGSTASANASSRNGSEGINASAGSTIFDNIAYQNGSHGITVGIGSTVNGNTAYDNGLDGIHVSFGSTVSASTAYQNGDDGIDCSSGCLVRGNAVRSNADYGLSLDSDSAYGDNVVTANTVGTVTGAGSANTRGNNYCAGTGTGSATCP